MGKKTHIADLVGLDGKNEGFDLHRPKSHRRIRSKVECGQLSPPVRRITTRPLQRGSASLEKAFLGLIVRETHLRGREGRRLLRSDDIYDLGWVI